MFTTTQLVIAACFCINATLALSFAFRYLNEKKPKSDINFLVYAVTISSAIWSIGMGIMSLQNDDTNAYFWREFGILGTFVFMASVQTTLCHVAEIPRAKRHFFNAISYTGIIVFFLYITPGQTVFVHNQIGTTFYFRQGLINIIYSFYFTIVSANILFVTLYMLRYSNLQKIRVAAKRFMIVEIFIFTGAIFDMIMPSFGIAALPGSAITHFWGVCVYWVAIHEMNKSKITIANMSEYIYNSLDTPVLVFNSEYRLEILNSASATFFQINEDSFVPDTMTIHDLFETEEPFFQFEERSCTKRAVCNANAANCELSVSKIKDSYKDVIGYILLINDLTEYEMVITKLEQAKLAADSANMSKSLFLANMSHELRTPMNAILGFSDIALAEKIDPQSREYFREIKNAGNILLSIISEILDISRIELGKHELTCGNYKPAHLFKDVETITSVNANKKGLQLITNIDPAFPDELYGDRDKIREILINLLSNAVKYTKEGSIHFSVRALLQNDNHAVIQFKVSDTGIGIRKEDIPSVFDKFQRLDAKLNSSTEGTGLGLSITKGLVDMMNGTITVDSEYGVGTTFTVELPQQIVSFSPIKLLDEARDYIESQTFKTSDFSNAKVLIIDDSNVNLKVASALLKSMFHISAELAASGAEGIEKCKNKVYDIVFLDQMMPVMDGIETIHEIRLLPGYEQGSNVKIIALTANVVNGVKEQLLNESFDDFLGKPIDKQILNELVSHALG